MKVSQPLKAFNNSCVDLTWLLLAAYTPDRAPALRALGRRCAPAGAPLAAGLGGRTGRRAPRGRLGGRGEGLQTAPGAAATAGRAAHKAQAGALSLRRLGVDVSLQWCGWPFEKELRNGGDDHGSLARPERNGRFWSIWSWFRLCSWPNRGLFDGFFQPRCRAEEFFSSDFFVCDGGLEARFDYAIYCHDGDTPLQASL